ncbi:MAG: DUF1549 and DUF1553 domain-containing protein [Verrucomicrobiota bacterium]|nr:DUF1549 and DUF1553 domain-containing protein [Verrucomicrobiota bacterium]
MRIGLALVLIFPLATWGEHWSLEPVRRPVPPTLGLAKRPANAVDSFVFAKLAKEGLAPSRLAERPVLIRRLHLVMLGMHPSPGEVAAFVNDPQPDAWERLVDRVLDDPLLGERWAQHWLDVIRYAETHGFETNQERPNAWPFRDWVVDAFNHDLPYDQFVRGQLAGDALGSDTGTGFLVAGPYDLVKSQDINLTLMQRQNELDGMINTTGTTFLGLTLGCARCHDHKFDPVTQRDYYSLQAIFAGVNHAERMIDQKRDPALAMEQAALESRVDSAKKELTLLEAGIPRFKPPVNARGNEEIFELVPARFIRFNIARANRAEPCVDELEIFAEGKNVALASAGAKATASGVYLDGSNPIHQLALVNDGRYGNSRSWIANSSTNAWVQIELPKLATIGRIKWARDREGRYNDRLAVEYTFEVATEPGQWRTVASSAERPPTGNGTQTKLEYLLAHLKGEEATKVRQLAKCLAGDEQRLGEIHAAMRRTVYAGTFRQPEVTHVLHRGDPLAKRDEVGPDGIGALGGALGLAPNAPEQQRRLKLAQWITTPDNPLTARVIVNRLWKHHFGTGLAATLNDLGVNGVRPTHPELLDWLAAELVSSGWSLKRIHRLILTSRAWRQSSQPRKEALAVDGGSRFLWRFPPRRLEAEVIRDNILLATGTLDSRMGGPGFSGFRVEAENVRHYHPKESYGPADWRRMLYMTKVRQEREPTFGVFDCPDFNQTVPNRSRSTTPLQSLSLLNSPFVLQQAGLLAKRLRHESGTDSRAQVARACQLALGREPTREELSDASGLVAEHTLEAFCRALFNANEFLFLP